jgi:hypothetical protein
MATQYYNRLMLFLDVYMDVVELLVDSGLISRTQMTGQTLLIWPLVIPGGQKRQPTRV